MEVVSIGLGEYVSFYKSIYKNDDSFKDNKMGVLNIICGKNRPFSENSRQKIISVKYNEKILCACVLIIHKNAPKMLSLAFFEALPDCKNAVDMLLDYAGQYGAQYGCRRIVVSLDGHVNNGIAFPAAKSSPSFGESYCPRYYHGYFERFNKIKFSSFFDHCDSVKARILKDLPTIEKLKSKITLEYADFGGGFAGTMRRYTDLNNEIFAGHKYYYHREYAEDYDLLGSMRPLLKNENLIFARYENMDIGFILWYPDFNELVSVGKGASILTFVKYKILRQYPKTVKVVEIGVKSEYRLFGTILLLFDAAINTAAKNTDKILSGWILDENTKSKAITQRYAAKHYKDYFAYEKDI